MKDFIVNNRILATVECDIPLRHCPVYYKFLQTKTGGGELSWTQNCDYNPDIVLNITAPKAAKSVKSEIMNLCMDCNVKAR